MARNLMRTLASKLGVVADSSQLGRTLGIDISKYQVFYKPGEDVDVDYVIQRVGYALKKDEAFDTLYLDIEATGVEIHGGYHYFSSGATWKDQADFYLETIKDKHFDFHACDMESSYNNMNESWATGGLEWMKYIKAQTGQQVFIYSNRNIYVNYLLQFVPASEWNKFPLWVALYYTLWSPDKEPNLAKMQRETWELWQYTQRGDGIAYGVASKQIDLDVFNGTLDEFKDFIDYEPPIIVNPCVELAQEAYDHSRKALVQLKMANEILKTIE